MRSQTCIIPVGGEGTRMGGLTETVPKCLLKTKNGRTLLEQVVEFWSADRYVVILNNFVSEITSTMEALRVDWTAVKTTEKTLASSICLAQTVVNTPFVIALGDCLFNGTFEHEVLRGVGVKEGTGEFHRTYAVGHAGKDDVTSLIEKPLMGLGCYWFDSADFEFFSEGGGMEHALERGMAAHTFKVNRFTGDYINVTYPEDLENWG